MYLYWRRGPWLIGLPLPLLLLLAFVVVPLWLAVGLVGTVVIVPIKFVVWLVNRAQRPAVAALMEARARAALEAERDKALAAAAPGPQRDEMVYWFRTGIDAYLDYKFRHGGQASWTTFARAMNSIDNLKQVHVNACRACGAPNQLVGRQCGLCSSAITFA